MKKCDHFKGLILTEYIDGESGKISADSIESHLVECGECRSFLKEVKDNAVLPLSQARQMPVPSELWDAIKENIEHGPQTANPFEEFIDRIKGLLAFPRVVPVFASLVLMLLVGSVAVNTIQVQQSQTKEQGEYLVSLLGTGGPLSSVENNDLGTPIEHYFL